MLRTFLPRAVSFPFRLGPAPYLESEIRPRWLNRLRECGLARLPSDRHHSDGQYPKGRLEIATRPARFHSPPDHETNHFTR
jgi:hypothetical protein